MGSSSRELLQKAVLALAERYDPDNDCFFVVVTKEGKLPQMDTGDQIIIGEMNIKTMIPFMVEAIHQVCQSTDMSPHDFLARYLTGAILADEREVFHGFAIAGDDFEDFEEEDDDDEEEDDETFEYSLLTKLADSVN